MDTFLSFFISHLPNIIQWIVATIILLIGSLFALMIFGKSKAQNAVETMGSLGDLGDFEVKLSEIVKRNMASTEVSSGTGSTATHGDSQGDPAMSRHPK